MSFQILYMHDICPDYKEFLKTFEPHARFENNFSISVPQKIGDILVASIFKNPSAIGEVNNMIGLFLFSLSTFETRLYFFKNSYYKMLFFDDKNYTFYGCIHDVNDNRLKISICEVNLRKTIERTLMEVPIMDLDNTNQLPNIYSNIKMINHQYIIIFVENSEQNGFRFILTDMVNEKYYVYEPRNCCGDYLLYTFSFMDYIPPVNNNDGYILIKTGKIEPHEKEMLWNNHNIERIVDALETFILYPQSKFIQDIILQKPYFDSYLVDCSLRNSSFDFYNFIDEQYYFYTKYKFDKNKTELIKINLHNLTKQDCYVLDGIVYPLLRDREGNFCVFQCLEEQENDKRKLKIVNHSVFKNEKHTVDIDISNDEQLLFAYNFSLVFENFISGFVLTASPKIDFINPKHYKIKIYSTKTKKPVYEFNTKHPVFLHCAYGLINDPLNPEEHLLLLF